MDSRIKKLNEDLQEQIDGNSSLSELSLPAIARPSVRLSTERVPNDQISLGASRIGGSPDTPPGFQWPRWIPAKSRNDKFGLPWNPDRPAPLGFIAQIDLSSIPILDDSLPSAGWLYFFYDRYCEAWGFDPNDRGCCRVLYMNCDRSLLQREVSPIDAEAEHTAESCAVECRLELTLPDDLPGISYGTAVFDDYHGILEDLGGSDGTTIHRMFGYPQPIQNPMELECQLASNGVYCGNPSGYNSSRAKDLEQGAAGWRLLLQIDTDEEGPGWMWGDVGRIYFWIKNQDLSSLRFDDVWLIFQCG